MISAIWCECKGGYSYKTTWLISADGVFQKPYVDYRNSSSSKEDRIAATIRHNRARGKHSVDAMSDIVVDLSRRNWSNEKIAKELGMDADEVLRLKQICGLAELFSDGDFSAAWVPER